MFFGEISDRTRTIDFIIDGVDLLRRRWSFALVINLIDRCTHRKQTN